MYDDIDRMVGALFAGAVDRIQTGDDERALALCAMAVSLLESRRKLERQIQPPQRPQVLGSFPPGLAERLDQRWRELESMLERLRQEIERSPTPAVDASSGDAERSLGRTIKLVPVREPMPEIEGPLGWAICMQLEPELERGRYLAVNDGSADDPVELAIAARGADGQPNGWRVATELDRAQLAAARALAYSNAATAAAGALARKTSMRALGASAAEAERPGPPTASGEQAESEGSGRRVLSHLQALLEADALRDWAYRTRPAGAQIDLPSIKREYRGLVAVQRVSDKRIGEVLAAGDGEGWWRVIAGGIELTGGAPTPDAPDLLDLIGQLELGRPADEISAARRAAGIADEQLDQCRPSLLSRYRLVLSK